MSAWRTMDSAPKDGTEVLFYGQRGDQIDIGSWTGCGRYHAKSKRGPAYFERAWGNGGHRFSPDPTHWMPLPPPPQVRP